MTLEFICCRGGTTKMVSQTNIDDLPQVYVRTPLIESVALRPFAGGRRIFLKLENTQPSGSFKLRGVSAQIRHAKARGYSRVIISSGGNAGLAAAYSALQLDMTCHIVVPRRTPKNLIDKMNIFNATVEIYGDSAQEVAQRAEDIAVLSPTTTVLIHPNDHQMLFQGHATMVDEIADDLGPGTVPSLIVTSCGGGGLLCGLVEGIRNHHWESRTKILVMETFGTDSFNACVKAGGKRVRLERMDSICTSLCVSQVSEQSAKCFLESKPPLLSRLVSDKDSVDACVKFANDHRFLVGPACGTTLAAVYQGFVERVLTNNEEEYVTIYDKVDYDDFSHNEDGPVIVIVDGGSEVTLESLAKLQKQFLTDQNDQNNNCEITVPVLID